MNLFHRHGWKFVGISYMEYVFGGGDLTQIKYRCECGRIKSNLIQGTWTAKELGLE